MATNYWRAVSNTNWSNDAAWSLGHEPEAGEDVVFDDLSVDGRCQIDVTTAHLGSFLLADGGGGAWITPTAGITVYIDGDMTFTQGRIDFATTSFWVVGGNVIRTNNIAQTWADEVTDLRMTGSGKSLQFAKGTLLWKLRVAGTISTTGTAQTGAARLVVESGKSLEIPTTKTFEVHYTGSPTGDIIDNDGTITGAGMLKIIPDKDDVPYPVTFGTVSCPTMIEAGSYAASHQILTLGEDTVFASALWVGSASATYNMTVAHNSNYTLTVAGTMTLGSRGILSQGTGKWTFGSYMQSGANSSHTHAGYFRVIGATDVTNGTWNVNVNARVGALSQNGGTITVASGYALFYDSDTYTSGTRTGTIVKWGLSVYAPTGTSTTEWTNPTYAYADDANKASCEIAAKNTEKNGIWTTFGVVNPSPEVTRITKVEIGTQHYLSTITSIIATMGREISWTGGSSWGTESVMDEVTCEVLVETATIWADVTNGRSWTWDELNNTNNQVRIACKQGNDATGFTMYLDVIFVRVTYIATESITKNIGSRVKAEGISLTKDAASRVKAFGIAVTKDIGARVKALALTIDKVCNARVGPPGGPTTYSINKDAAARIKAFGLEVTKQVGARIKATLSTTRNIQARVKAQGVTITKNSAARVLGNFQIQKQINSRVKGTVSINKAIQACVDWSTPPTAPSEAGSWWRR